jgi:CubicO group peptidase (beta-lactamase class C family)
MFSDVRIADALGIPLPISRERIATFMIGQPLQSTPGAQFAYSNFGYSLLGKVIEVTSGLSYQEYVIQMVFSPLNITRPRLAKTLCQFQLDSEVNYHSQFNGSTVFDRSGTQVPSPYGAWNIENMDAHGGWLASAVDLVRFASTFDNASTSPVLNQASIDSMFGLPENILSADYEAGSYY